MEPPFSCWEVVKQGQGHSGSPRARLYGADASDDPVGFFAFSVHLHSTSLDDENICDNARRLLFILCPRIGLTFHTKEMVSRILY